jgi:lipopolysaccharide export system protein LptA
MPYPRVQIAFGLLCLIFLPLAQAARSDSLAPLSMESDQPGKIDLKKNIVEFNGHVLLTKGTLTLQASRIEIRETPGGHHQAVATGTAASPARFRQKREGLDEFIEGVAERLEYDSRTETVQFIHKAAVRRLRGSQVADEISGERVSYNNRTEVFNVSGSGGAQGTRVRAVLTPRKTASSGERSEQAQPAALELPTPPASAASAGATRFAP